MEEYGPATITAPPDVDLLQVKKSRVSLSPDCVAEPECSEECWMETETSCWEEEEEQCQTRTERECVTVTEEICETRREEECREEYQTECRTEQREQCANLQERECQAPVQSIISRGNVLGFFSQETFSEDENIWKTFIID